MAFRAMNPIRTRSCVAEMAVNQLQEAMRELAALDTAPKTLRA